MPPGPVRLQAQINTYTYGQSPFLTTWFDGKRSFAEATPVTVIAGSTSARDIPLIKGAAITGTVLASGSSSPVEDATVEVCYVWFYSCRSVTTDADGSYAAVGLEAGQYVVRVLAPAGSNLLTGYFGGTDQNSATKLTLALGQTAASTTITLPIGAQIGGRALDGDGAAVSDASVTAYRTNTTGTSWDASAQATTLADGSYVFHALQPGKYRIRVVPTATSPLAPGWFGGASTWNAAAEITASSADELTGKDVFLAPGATLSGRVLGGPGTPVEDATVSVYTATQYGYEQLKSATSAGDGSYTVKGLAAGTYRIQVTPDSSSVWLPAWLGGDCTGTPPRSRSTGPMRWRMSPSREEA